MQCQQILVSVIVFNGSMPFSVLHMCHFGPKMCRYITEVVDCVGGVWLMIGSLPQRHYLCAAEQHCVPFVDFVHVPCNTAVLQL